MQKRNCVGCLATAFWLIFVVTIALPPLPLTAQTSLGTSSIGGTVRDPSSLGVAGVAIHLVDTQRGTTRNTVTNGQGEYLFTAVLPGIYTVTAEQKGFRRASIENVQVIIDQRATVDVMLQLGAVSQSVEVNSLGATPLLDTASNALGTVMDNARVENLPLNGRNFLQLGMLVGGSQTPTGGSDVVSGQTGHSDLGISVTGANEFETTYFIDGIETRGSRIGDSSLNMSVAAIDQFKIELGFFMPDLGPNAGIIDVLTKSGTNNFHGEAYEFLRNTDLNGRNYFASSAQILQRNQFGFALGGPVILPKLVNGHDKLWFHANYEGVRQIQDTVATGFTPTQAMLGGDFSAEPSITIYNPYSYNATTGTRSPFAGNVITPSLINPISKALLSYYLPGASYTETPINLTRYPRDLYSDNQFTIRADAAISKRQSLLATVSHENSPVVNQGLMPLQGNSYPIVSDLAVLQHTLVIGPHMVNIARVGWDRAVAHEESQGEASAVPLETQLGIPGTVDPNGIPSMSIQGFSGFGNSVGLIGSADDSYQIDDAFDYSKGTHNFAFGAGLTYTRTVQENANATATGSLTFSPIFSAQLAHGSAGPTPVSGTGNALADFLLGMPISGTVLGFHAMDYRYTQFYPYFQDSWRFKPNLTINYGIGWYFSTIPNPQGADAQIPHDFNFSTGLLQYAELGQISPQVIKPDYHNFTPRLGFAWQPSFLKNTVVHAGVGLFFEQMGLIETQFTYLAPPFENNLSFSNSQFSPMPTYAFGNSVAADDVFPVVPLQPLSSTFAATLPSGFTPEAVNPNSTDPYVSQWTSSVQHTFGANDLVEIDYVGNSAHHQQNRYDANQCVTQVGDSRAAALIPADLFCNSSLKPYPKYGYILYSNTNGNMSYEAAILKYQHHFSKGLTILANYTYSKTLSDSWEVSNSTNSQVASCRSCDKGPVTYDIPQQFIVSTIYELPFGRGRMFGNTMPRVADLFLGGWSLSDITTFSAGSAFTVSAPNNTGAPFTLVRANRLCNGKDKQFSGHLRSNGFLDFDTACFATPAADYFGTSGKGILFGPGTDNSDMGISKQAPLTEKLKLEVRGEFFNAFNHANFGLPAAVVGTPTFGKVSSASSPRLIQVAGRIIW